MPRTAQMGLRFWQQAERDIEVARTLLQPGSYYAAANFAHQAAEKALKAACWHVAAEEPPWTHDLEAVAKLVSERLGGHPPGVELAIDRLEPMFVLSRYPSGKVDEPIPANLIREQDAAIAVESAQEVTAWVRELLRRPPGRARRKRSS